jgi:hypothetical protein
MPPLWLDGPHRATYEQRSRQSYETNFTKEHFVQRMIDTMHLALCDIPNDAYGLAASDGG